MNILMGNPLVTVGTGTDQSVSVPSTALPEYQDIGITAPGGSSLPSLLVPQQQQQQTSTSSSSVSLGDILSAGVAIGQAAAGAATGGALGGGVGSLASGTLVTIVLGVLFIAAGVFSFRAPREIVLQGAKAAAAA